MCIFATDLYTACMHRGDRVVTTWCSGAGYPAPKAWEPNPCRTMEYHRTPITVSATLCPSCERADAQGLPRPAPVPYDAPGAWAGPPQTWTGYGYELPQPAKEQYKTPSEIDAEEDRAALERWKKITCEMPEQRDSERTWAKPLAGPGPGPEEKSEEEEDGRERQAKKSEIERKDIEMTVEERLEESRKRPKVRWFS